MLQKNRIMITIWTIKHCLFRRFSRIISIWKTWPYLIHDVPKWSTEKRGSNTTYILYRLMDTNKLKLLKVIAVLNLVIANLWKLLKRLKVPVIIAGLQETVTKDVVEYEIPLLLSKEAMKNTKTQIYFLEDRINMFGKKVKIYFTSTGHYFIKLKSKLSDGNVFKTNAVFLCSNIHNLSSTEKY